MLQPPAGYVPIRTPARKLTATPTPMGGMGGGGGFHMQQEGTTVDPGLAQPPGNLPFLKPDDTQYFGKLLVSDVIGSVICDGNVEVAQSSPNISERGMGATDL